MKAVTGRVRTEMPYLALWLIRDPEKRPATGRVGRRRGERGRGCSRWRLCDGPGTSKVHLYSETVMLHLPTL